MYSVSRLCLIVAAAAGSVALAACGILFWPASGWLAGLFLLGRALRRRSVYRTTLGSARWAERNELRRRGMIGGDAGLILGRLGGAARDNRFRNLWDRRITAKAACLGFWIGLGGRRQELVRLSQAIHVAVFSPSGGGKGVSFVIPFLRSCPDSCVVLDLKGENALKTAEYRRRYFNHETIFIDPFHLVTETPNVFNPLDAIAPDGPYSLDDVHDLAKALVVRAADAREPHWDDSAEFWIAAIIAVIVRYGDVNESRNLQMLRDILSHPQKLETAVKLLCESEDWGGMLARMGGQLSHFIDKERASTLTTSNRHVRFLDTPAVAASTKSTDFDPKKLLAGKMTIYLVLPPTHFRPLAGLLRVWISSLLRIVVHGGLQERNKVHFIFDEAASLGHMDCIDDAVDKYRGYGVRLQFYFQSLGQLRKCFPEGQEQTLLSNTTQIFFGVNDNPTADYVSNRLGEETIVVDSGGTTHGGSSQWSHGAQPSSGGGSSHSSNANWQQQARRLLKPEEVMAASPRMAITFTPGVRPICTMLLRYYEERKSFGRPPSALARALTAGCVLLYSVALCGLMILLAVATWDSAKSQMNFDAAPTAPRVYPQQTDLRAKTPARRAPSCRGATSCPKPPKRPSKTTSPPRRAAANSSKR
jgi:type IV secretion system protein VirD4